MRAVRLSWRSVVIVASIPAANLPRRRPLGYFEGSGDVGQPAIAGSTTYDPARADLHDRRRGHEHVGRARRVPVRVAQDDRRLHRPHARGVHGTGVDPHRKIGWIIRRTLDADSPYVDAAVHGDGLTSLQFRGRPAR